jgi:hypothetical protein
LGWEYSKVLSSNEDGSPASIEAADGTELVFYEESEFYNEYDYDYDYDYSDYMNLYLIPSDQSPDNYKDILQWSVDMNAFMTSGKFQGWMYYQDIGCLVTADTPDGYYVEGLIIEQCSSDIGWTYAEVVKREPETGDPISVSGPGGIELVFYEEWEIYGEKEEEKSGDQVKIYIGYPDTMKALDAFSSGQFALVQADGDQIILSYGEEICSL